MHVLQLLVGLHHLPIHLQCRTAHHSLTTVDQEVWIPRRSKALKTCPECLQAPDADQLQRLQALLGVAGLPPRTFLSFLLLVTLAPGSSSGGSSGNSNVAGGHTGGAKRRRLDAAPQAPGVSPTVQRAIQMAESVMSEGETAKQTR